MPRTLNGLARAVERQIITMIMVATGARRIQEANRKYILDRRRIAKCLRIMGIKDPNPFDDLWQWHEKWKNGSLPSWQSRRVYVRDLYKPLLDQIRAGGPRFRSLGSPTGWTRVDRCIDKVRVKLAEARDEEDFQGIGLLCREATISIAQAIYDPRRHPILDGVDVSHTDAKRQIEAFMAVELSGSSNEAIRKHARAALDLANALQHTRTADFRLAALAAEATTADVNILAIVAGRRDPAHVNAALMP